jgi:hypothetical protein
VAVAATLLNSKGDDKMTKAMGAWRKAFAISVIGAGLLATGAAKADCWDQCVARNPLTGGCVARTRVCNIEDAGHAAESMGTDIQAAYGKIQDRWRDVYGAVPGPLREAMERYPITIAAVLVPGTREYWVFTMTLEEFVHQSQRRSAEAQQVVAERPQDAWVAGIMIRGESLIFALGGIQVSGHDYKSPGAEPILVDKYQVVWDDFTSCVRAAQDAVGGEACLRTLRINASLID